VSEHHPVVRVEMAHSRRSARESGPVRLDPSRFGTSGAWEWRKRGSLPERPDIGSTKKEAVMERRAGTGILVFGLVLAVAGAIMRYALTVHTTGFNNHTGGVILLIVGIVTFVAGLLIFALGGRRSSSLHDSIRQTPQGQERVEKKDTWSTI
jgi:hypothetical protein